MAGATCSPDGTASPSRLSKRSCASSWFCLGDDWPWALATVRVPWLPPLVCRTCCVGHEKVSSATLRVIVHHTSTEIPEMLCCRGAPAAGGAAWYMGCCISAGFVGAVAAALLALSGQTVPPRHLQPIGRQRRPFVRQGFQRQPFIGRSSALRSPAGMTSKQARLRNARNTGQTRLSG